MKNDSFTKWLVTYLTYFLIGATVILLLKG